MARVGVAVSTAAGVGVAVGTGLGVGVAVGASVVGGVEIGSGVDIGVVVSAVSVGPGGAPLPPPLQAAATNTSAVIAIAAFMGCLHRPPTRRPIESKRPVRPT